MSDKTLGQIYRNNYALGDDPAWASAEDERVAAGIAAVARHVFEQMILERVHAAITDAAATKPSDPPQPEAATGDDELRKALQIGYRKYRLDTTGRVLWFYLLEEIRPLFDALRRERDEAIDHRNDSIGDAEHMADKYHQAIKRAEAAEAALVELRAACEWTTCSGCSPSKGQDGRWRSMFLPDAGIEAATLADAILAAYRATKATPVAEGTMKR